MKHGDNYPFNLEITVLTIAQEKKLKNMSIF